MTRLWHRLKSLAPFAQGVLGALLCVLVLASGWQVYTWCQQFVVMRSVVGQLIDQSNKQAAQQKQAATPEAPKK